MSSLYTESELERVARSIASCMQCGLCPNPCKARDNSSMHNCVSHWMEIIKNAANDRQTQQVN